MAKDRESLLIRIRDLEERLAEANETLRALRDGEVDAILAQGPEGFRVYTLKGADEPYRLMVQQMAEGALTLTLDGWILFTNQQFADMVELPLERVIGSPITDFLDDKNRIIVRALLDSVHVEPAKAEVSLQKSDGGALPAYLSVNRMQIEACDTICMIVTDLTAQKRNETIVAAEQFARSILEQAAEAILVLNSERRIVRASATADRLAGFNVLFKTIGEVFLLRNADGTLIDLESLLAAETRQALTAAVEIVDGTLAGKVFDVLLSAAGLSAGIGEPSGCIIHLADITRLKHIEKELRASEAMYRSLADAMPQIVYVNRPDGSCEYVNRKWYEFTGDSRLVGALDIDWAKWVHPADAPHTVQNLVHSMQSGFPYQLEFRLRRRDGEYRWMLARAVPVLGEDGSIAKWIATSTDIHEFKVTEAMLRDSEDRLKNIAETVPGILFTTLPNGHCDYVSARAYEVTGLPLGSIEAFGWMELIHADDRERVLKSWTEARTRRAPSLVEYKMRHAGSNYRWMEVRTEPQFGPAGELVKWFGVCTDIDHHKQLEASLEHRTAELGRSNEELQRFAFAASHDLQAPLRSIGILSELLATDSASKIDAESAEKLKLIRSSVSRMSTLIRDLLDYSRAGGAANAAPEHTDCDTLIDFALLNLQSQITQTGAFVTRDSLPVVKANVQLLRVFQNLLANALAYRSEAVPKIHISAEEINEEWVFSIRDNGIGFDLKDAQRIFDIFERLPTPHHHEGSGLGLAICRKIVELCGGRIWAESSPGAGSTFYFSLPRKGRLVQEAQTSLSREANA